MNLFDPLRPVLPDGTPQYLTAEGSPVAAMPGFYARVLPNGGVSLGIMVRTSRKGYSWQHHVILPEEFPGLVSGWLESPEAIMRAFFNYEPSNFINEREESFENNAKTPGPSLEELGLLD